MLTSDPSEELQTAVIAALRADPGVIAAFAPDKVRLYDTPPTVAPKDRPRRYVVIGLIQPLPIHGTDVANTEVTIDTWSQEDPPSKAVAARINAAVMPCVLGLADLPSHTVKSTLPTDIRCFTDPVDAVTGHGIVKFEIVTQPKS